jgi:hypothetical protein
MQDKISFLLIDSNIKKNVPIFPLKLESLYFFRFYKIFDIKKGPCGPFYFINLVP